MFKNYLFLKIGFWYGPFLKWGTGRPGVLQSIGCKESDTTGWLDNYKFFKSVWNLLHLTVVCFDFLSGGMWYLSSPDQGINRAPPPTAPALESGVLTTGPPRKSLIIQKFESTFQRSRVSQAGVVKQWEEQLWLKAARLSHGHWIFNAFQTSVSLLEFDSGGKNKSLNNGELNWSTVNWLVEASSF